MTRTPADEAKMRRMAIRRRRHILYMLMGVAGSTLLVGLFPGHRNWLYVHALADLGLVAYIVMLLLMKRPTMRAVAPDRSRILEPHRDEEFLAVEHF